MATEVTIVNAALIAIGARTIATLADNTPGARLANSRYIPLRDDLLRDHPWNFAMRRVTLEANAVGVDWGFANAYLLPTDCLIVREVNGQDSGEDWRVERISNGTVIATDLGPPAAIRYTARITDVDIMDARFREALAAVCAADWCEKLTGSSDQTDKLRRVAIFKLQAARHADGQEMTPERLEAFGWTDSRW